jgi:hypothetical protein
VQDEAVKANQGLSRKRRNRVWCPSEVLVWSPTEVLQFQFIHPEMFVSFGFVLTSKNPLFSFCPHSEATGLWLLGALGAKKDDVDVVCKE